MTEVSADQVASDAAAAVPVGEIPPVEVADAPAPVETAPVGAPAQPVGAKRRRRASAPRPATSSTTAKRGAGRPPKTLNDKLLAVLFPNGRVPARDDTLQRVQAWLVEANDLVAEADR